MIIKGSVVLVTGASSGIGAAIAEAMAKRGARVLLLARNESALEKVAAKIAALGGEASTYVVDLTDAEAVEQVADRIKKDSGIPDILINNAGAGRWASIEETHPEEVVQMMAVPYFAAFYVTRSFLPGMRRRNSGHIVNITSVGGYFAWPGAAGYLAARWAMRGFTEALRAELQGTGIGVTLFASSTVKTPYFEHNRSEAKIPKSSAWVPILRPEQVAEAIVLGVERNRREIVMPPMMKFIVTMHRFFPRLIERQVSRKTGAR